MTFVFKAQNNVERMICDTVRAIGGKVVSHKGTVITAKWRSKRYLTVFRKTFKFYIGSDVVRVNYGTYTGSNGRGMITLSHGKGGGIERLWMEFVEQLLATYPGVDFGIRGCPITLDSIKILSNGIEQVMTTTAVTNNHWFIPDMTYAVSQSKSRFAKELLASAIYSNGLLVDGVLIKNSATYNEIMASMSKYQK